MQNARRSSCATLRMKPVSLPLPLTILALDLGGQHDRFLQDPGVLADGTASAARVFDTRFAEATTFVLDRHDIAAMSVLIGHVADRLLFTEGLDLGTTVRPR